MISLIAGGLTYLLLKQKRRLFIIFLLLFSVYSTYRVNPIYRGLDPILNTPLSKSIQAIESTNKSKSRWAVYNDRTWGQYIIANGAHSLSGVYLYPQFELWKQFDPKEQYKNVWNRYAHVWFVDDDNRKELFKLEAEDALTININPCDKVLEGLNVKYFLFVNSKPNYKCLKTVEEIKTPKIKFDILQRIN